MSEQLEPLIGQRIGSYEVVRLLGQGGMGAVYEARHAQLGRRAAIKVLHAHFAHRPQFTQRFFNEARAVNIVEHPGLVEIYEYGQLPDRSAYLIMEFLRGESLRQRLVQRGRLIPAEAAAVARQVAGALAAAHEKDIIHRDLKPDNVMLVPDRERPGRERVKVLDFGIAKVAVEQGGVGQRTETQALMGTPSYMSPEQCRGAGRVSVQTDVYALGVMLYEMLAGTPPFVAEGHGEMILLHMTAAPPPLPARCAGLPPGLWELVERMLAKAPEARPTMLEVAAALAPLEGSLVGPEGAVQPSGMLQVPSLQPGSAGTLGTLGNASGQAAPPNVRRGLRWGLSIGAGGGVVLLVGALASQGLRRPAPDVPAPPPAVRAAAAAIAAPPPVPAQPDMLASPPEEAVPAQAPAAPVAGGHRHRAATKRSSTGKAKRIENKDVPIFNVP